jgi:CarboxypepD_reg-like domain
MKLTSLFTFTFALSFNCLMAQTFSGVILSNKNGQPVPFVNIGLVGQNIGTVSDENGKFSLNIDEMHDKDTLKASCIGFNSFAASFADFKKKGNYTIRLDERVTQLPELVVVPKNFVAKTLGVTTKSKKVSVGYKSNELGKELGILMTIKKTAILERVKLNFAACTFDSIFYRLNIYRFDSKKEFENVLQKPIYIYLSKNQTLETVVVDLKPYNLVMEGDFLVSLEHIKNLGEGKLYFCAKIGTRSYFRSTSQAKWDSVPFGVSISVDAQVEK